MELAYIINSFGTTFSKKACEMVPIWLLQEIISGLVSWEHSEQFDTDIKKLHSPKNSHWLLSSQESVVWSLKFTNMMWKILNVTLLTAIANVCKAIHGVAVLIFKIL